MSDHLTAALEYASRGWPVFPVRPRDKMPAVSGGFKQATLMHSRVRSWWNGHDYNIGIATGELSGFFVLDVDGDRGAYTLDCLETRHGKLPSTRTAWSATGCHLYFKANGPVPSRVNILGNDSMGEPCGLDTRGNGGYIIAPPSIHPSGAVYRWSGPDALASAPNWLVHKACRRPSPAPTYQRVLSATIGSPENRARGQAALSKVVLALSKVEHGGRNAALFRASAWLHGLVLDGDLNAGEVRVRLVEACIANGLDKDEGGLLAVHNTITSGERAAQQGRR